MSILDPAALTLLQNTFGERAEAEYNNFSPYEQAVFLNTVAGIADAGDKILNNAKFEGFYNSSRENAPPFGIIVSGVTTDQLNSGGLGKSLIFGRRSRRKIATGSVEATVKDKSSGTVAFDIDLYNPKSGIRDFTRHIKEVRFNRKNKATTHPADVARALLGRGVNSGVTTP